MYSKKISSLYTVFSVALVFSSTAAALSNDEAHDKLHKRVLSSVAIIGGDTDRFACTEDQRTTVRRAVNDARALATAASAVLEISGSETSEAFEQWFGLTNARSRAAIRTSNYEALLTDLNEPTVVLEALSDNNLDASGLTFACGGDTMPSCGAGSSTIAIAHENDEELTGNVIVLCPRFFNLISNQEMLSNILVGSFPDPSQGFALVHEIQHLSAVVGAQRRCADQPDPSGGRCYSTQCCSSLPDNLKILNAQNMAYFAADVMADPSRGAPPEQNQCVVQKRSDQSMANLRRWENQFNSLRTVGRRQATNSASSTFQVIASSAPSSRPASSAASTRSASSAASTRSASSAASTRSASSAASTRSASSAASTRSASSAASTRSASSAASTSATSSAASTRPASSSSAPPPTMPPVNPPAGSTSSSPPPPATTTNNGGGGGGVVPVVPPAPVVPPVAPVPPANPGGDQPANSQPANSEPTTTTTQRCSSGTARPFPTGNAPPDADGLSAEDIQQLRRLAAPAQSTARSSRAVTAVPSSVTVVPSTQASSQTSTATASSLPPLPPQPEYSDVPGFTKVFEADGVSSIFQTAEADTASEGFTGDPLPWCVDKCKDGCDSIFLSRQTQLSGGEYNVYFICNQYNRTFGDDLLIENQQGRVDSAVAYNKN